MKTFSLLFSLLFSLFVSSPILAQITITTTDVLNMFAVGKGQKHLSADDTLVFSMNVGAATTLTAQAWMQFSGLSSVFA